MEYASLSDRFLGQVIDGLVAAIPFVIGVCIGMFVESLAPIGIVVGAVAAIAYYFVCDGLENGQSIGKRMLGIKVVDRSSGQPCSMGQSFIRNVILAALGPIDWIFIFGSQRQRLGDKAAGTVVIPA